MISALITADCLNSGGYFAISRSIFRRESVVSMANPKSGSEPYFQKKGRFFPSSVDFPEDDVLSSDDGDGVRDHVTASHLVEGGEVREAGGADLEAVRLVRAVGDEVDAELALGRLHGG